VKIALVVVYCQPEMEINGEH